MIAADIALAFNTANTRKSWSARPNARDTGEVVHFTAPTNLVTLILHCSDGRYEVRFNKFQASWGDYVKATARALYVVLTTLKAAGLLADAPASPDGIQIVTTASADATTWVRWDDPTPG